MTRAIGIDVGGSKCLGVVLDEHGHVVVEERRPTPRGEGSLPQLIDVLAELVAALGPYEHLGVGVPGLVTRDGVLGAAPNLDGVAHYDVAGHLADRLGHRVAVDNDATCAVLAEWMHGVGRGATDLVLVTLGTGIGGGLVLGGQLQRGANGFAGEYGHMVVDPDGPPCPCGRRGCWERYASGSGLARLAREAAVGRRVDRVLELADGDSEAVRGEMVQQAAREGDTDALAVIDDFSRWVALGLVNLTNALDPEMFVLGGGLAAGADLYLDPIRRWFRELLYQPELRPLPAVAFAGSYERAGAIGAALLHTVVDTTSRPDRLVVLHEPDPRWQTEGAVQAERVRGALGEVARAVEHVGSTSVPGLAAKPVLDLVVAVPDSTDEESYVPALEALGYGFRLREPDWFEHRLLELDEPAVNLHIFTDGCSEIDEMIAFRDHLRAAPGDRQRYEAEKRRLASQDWQVVQDYADAKSPVVADIKTRMHRP
jgi:glucokinase